MSAPVLTLAMAAAAAPGGRLVLADVLEVPEGESFSSWATAVRARREALLDEMSGARRLGGAPGHEPLAEAVVRVGYQRWAELLALCQERHADLLVLPLETWRVAGQA